MEKLCAAERALHSGLVPACYAEVEGSHLRWMRIKDAADGHDMFLIGPPGSLRRRVAMRYAEVAGREVEHVVITRDTTEADLKQRKEVVGGGSTVWVDSAPVRAAVHGRLLLLDGIEKAERNVLPTLNNLLENREVQLDDGRFLMNHTRFDDLARSLPGGAAECRRRGLVRVAPEFRVVALGLPVPPFHGAPLDPPLRSRFQARFVATSVDALGGYPRLAAAVAAINLPPDDGRPRLPCISHDAVLRMRTLLQLPPHARPTPADALNRAYPIAYLTQDAAVRNSVAALLRHFGLDAGDKDRPAVKHVRVQAAAGEAGGEAVVTFEGPSGVGCLNLASPHTAASQAQQGQQGPRPPQDAYVMTPALRQLLSGVVQDLACGHDVCVFGDPGAGKSRFVRHVAEALGYGPAQTAYLFMYGDMTSRDLVQRRVTDANGNTRWAVGTVVKAAREGSLLVLDGVHRLPGDLIAALAPLLQDRQLQLHTEGEGVEVLLRGDRRRVRGGGGGAVHPHFRVIALASPPTPKDAWCNEEFTSLFSFHSIPKWTSGDVGTVLRTLHPTLNGGELVPPLVKLMGVADAELPPVSLRQLLRAANAAAHPTKTAAAAAAAMDAPQQKQRAADTLARQMLVSSLPPEHRAQVLTRFERAFGGLPRPVGVDMLDPQGAGAGVSPTTGGSSVVFGDVVCPTSVPANPERVPQVAFVEIARHMTVLAGLARELFVRGERYLLLLGPQGVGKNRITDYLLQRLRWERMYMQLHRDTTVQQLTATPQLDDGVLTWKDSPLVIAAKEGLCLVLDEADKAPLEVVVLLKSLVEDGQLALADGRRIVRGAETRGHAADVIPLHPGFRMIVLANRPGFPFLGNDLFRECGDVFSVFSLDNPDADSELQLLAAVAPGVDPVLLRRLVLVFAELRTLNTSGRLSYPYSTRELLHIARHLNAHPDASIGEALNNVLSFDRLDPAAALLQPVFERHGIPVKDVLSGDVDRAELAPEWQRAEGVLKDVDLAPAVPIGPARVLGTQQGGAAAALPAPVKPCTSSPLTPPTPATRPLRRLRFHRAYTFSELLMTYEVPTDEALVDATVTSGATRWVHMLTEQPIGLWSVPDPLATGATSTECMVTRWGAFGGALSSTTTLVVNGRSVQAGGGQLARVGTAGAVGVYVPGDTDPFVVVTPYGGAGTGSPVTLRTFRLPQLFLKGRKTARYFLCEVRGPAPSEVVDGTAPEQPTRNDGAVAAFDPAHVVIFASPHDRQLVAVDVVKRLVREIPLGGVASTAATASPTASAGASTSAATPPAPQLTAVSAYVHNGAVRVVANDHVVTIPSYTGEPAPVRVEHRPVTPAAPAGVLAPATWLHGTAAAAPEGGAYAYITPDEQRRVLGWPRAAAAAAAAAPRTAHAAITHEGVVVYAGRGGDGAEPGAMCEMVDTHGCTAKAVKAPAASGEPQAVIAARAVYDAVEGDVAMLITERGRVTCVQVGEKKLLPALVTYLRIRGVGRYVDAALREAPKPSGKGKKWAAGDLTQRVAALAGKGKRRELQYLKDREAGTPKEGKHDNDPHVGGNQFAGGSGGSDTAGLGGRNGPFRMDKGHDVHQISDEAKANISKEAKEAARKMGQEALAKRLKEIDMGSGDYAFYRQLQAAVAKEVDALRAVLKRLEAASRERVWLRGTEGELDDNRLVDARAGESNVFRRRADQKHQPNVLVKPKRLVFLFDCSASMVRFNGVDGRLQSAAEAAVMLMEAMAGCSTRFEWALVGHSGDSPQHVFVPFGTQLHNDMDRLRVVQRMWAHAEYCGSGDHTLQALEKASHLLEQRAAARGPADEQVVIAFSDANMDRYGITGERLERALKSGKNVHQSIFFIASSNGEAERITQKVPPGHAYTVLDMKHMPTMIKTVFAHSLQRAARTAAL